MTERLCDQAWNNFVMCSDPFAADLNIEMRQAAIANMFMGVANNGGLNGFLTSTWDFDATEVVRSLAGIGAKLAAAQLNSVLQALAIPLPAMSQDARWEALDAAWTDELDENDTLTSAADIELMCVLSGHVVANEEYYLHLS